ncbi:helix-turn-helix domain-containing protein [Nocardiopsis nanhaiensis]
MAEPRGEIRVIEHEKLLVSVRKAAEILDISERVVYDLCYTEELESVKIGPKKWIRRITCESINEYVEKARTESRDSHLRRARESL